MLRWIIPQLAKLRRKGLDRVLGSLMESAVNEAFRGFRSRCRLYTAWGVVRTFLTQMAVGDSCRSAVERAIQQQWIPANASPNTGAYCQARKELPERSLRQLALEVGQQLESTSEESWQWLGRRVKVVDGSSSQLPDTPANQKLYPQPPAQKPGCGFPVMYFVALMSLATGAIEAVQTGRMGKERAMFRNLWQHLQRGDVVLGDAGFGSFAEIALLVRRGIDVVFRAGGKRKLLQGARRLGSGQWLVKWYRPDNLSSWVPVHLMPETLTVRIIQFRVPQRGFRSQEIVLITTLGDCQRYPKRKLVQLYRRRWDMELRLRDIKSTLGMDRLSCKDPQRCRKELWMGLLFYNLTRMIMMEAARQGRLPLPRISFAGAVQRLGHFACGRLVDQDPEAAYWLLLKHLIQDRLPLRPNRIEPRKIKYRGKNYRLLNRPRYIERALLFGA